MRKIVGISQKIKRAWLDVVLDRLDQALNEKEVRAFLDRRHDLPGVDLLAPLRHVAIRDPAGIAPGLDRQLQ